MGLNDVVLGWADDPDLEGELTHVEQVASRGAIFGDLDPPLDETVADRLTDLGIDRLYRHQAKAINHIRSRQHTVVVAGTSSGKTLCYSVPIAEQIVKQPRSTSLLLYPTKALAQDQLRGFGKLAIDDLTAATYDGDTEIDQRAWVRKNANVVLTNPDMLHMGILPNHAKWADFLVRLKFIVVDEMHMFRGIFGSHVALILRRLRRLAAHYGANPTFVFTSATIGNPQDLAQRLCGLEVGLRDEDNSPTGEKMVALWNPPIEDADLGRRRSAMAETSDLFVDLVRKEHHTIVFSRSRKATELIFRWTQDRLPEDKKQRIAPYRSGYTAASRRETEAALFSGNLLGVTATNALELGIDVGSLDAAIVNTFPGTISSFRQQAGRAGRTQRASVAVLVGGEDALDQYFMNHPRELFDRTPESVVINPANPLVLQAHVACAAHELPLEPSDSEFLGDGTEEAATALVAEGHLEVRRGRLMWNHPQAPAPRVSIRSSGGPTYTISSPDGVIGTMEETRAFTDGHPDAIYLHQGETFVVEDLDIRRHEIRVNPGKVNYYTQSKSEKFLEVLEVFESRPLGSVTQHYGSIRVESQVIGYQKKKIGSGETIAHEWLDLPPSVFETEGVWLEIPDGLVSDMSLDRMLGTLHAAEHAGIAMLPLFAVCDRWDIGGLSTNWHPDLGGPAIFIYEAYPGGAGISPVAFDIGLDHWRSTRDAVEACPCKAGCPSCVVSPKCGNYNEPLDKAGAVDFLTRLLP